LFNSLKDTLVIILQIERQMTTSPKNKIRSFSIISIKLFRKLRNGKSVGSVIWWSSMTSPPIYSEFWCVVNKSLK